jgi:DNA-directed RNA polymerase specialized sigma24 family protein
MTTSTRGPAELPAYDVEGVTRLLGPLTVNEREVFLLRYLCGYTPHEAGAALGLSDGKVAWRLHTGLTHLHDDLVAHGRDASMVSLP